VIDDGALFFGSFFGEAKKEHTRDRYVIDCSTLFL